MGTTIDSLLWLYTECAKTKISEESLGESLKLLGFKEGIRQAFIQCYLSKANQLQTVLTTDLALSLPRYKNLNWRFDVQVNLFFVFFLLLNLTLKILRSHRNLCVVENNSIHFLFLN